MPKRRSTLDAAPSKHRRNEPHVTTVICGVYAEGKAAVARCLLKELKSATVLVSNLEEGQAAVPKKGGAFEVRDYKTETPQLPPQHPRQNVVVLSHDLARPSRIAAAMADQWG